MSTNHTRRPYMFRWLFTVQDDPGLSWKAKTAAVSIFRYANMEDGKGCYVGAAKAGREAGRSADTIQAGWRELQEAGYLGVWKVPANRREQRGDDKWARFPQGAPDTLSAAPVEAKETSSHLSEQASRSPEPVSPADLDPGNAEHRRMARDLLHSGEWPGRDAVGWVPCWTCGGPVEPFHTDCLDCIHKAEQKAAAAAPPVGHRDDWELRNA